MICSGLVAKIEELPDSEVKRILVGEAKREFLQITADANDQEGAPDRKKPKHSKSAKGMKPLYEYFVKGKMCLQELFLPGLCSSSCAC